MGKIVFTEQDVLQQERVAQNRIQKSRATAKDKDLKLPGAEVVALFLAGKVVLPIICGMISRVLYDKFKNIQTKSDADAARKAIVQAPAQDKPVDRGTIQTEVTKSLVDEGLPPAAAEKIVKETIDDIASKHFAKS
jgi:hypothetical protein